MKKLLRYKLTDHVKGARNSLFFNEDGEGFINPIHISQLKIEKNEINLVLGDIHDGAHISFEFSKEGMGEYHRMKRELEEIFS